MMARMVKCPNDLDERLELYCLDRLCRAEARQLEGHVAQCPACLYELLDTDLFLDSLVSALDEVEMKEPERE